MSSSRRSGSVSSNSRRHPGSEREICGASPADAGLYYDGARSRLRDIRKGCIEFLFPAYRGRLSFNAQLASAGLQFLDE